MKKKIFITLFALVLAQNIFSDDYKLNSCFPVSSIKYEVGNKSFNNGLSEEEFNQTIGIALSVFGPEIKKRFNKTLIIEKKWNEGTVDASATRDDLDNPVVIMNGGLARHPLMTKDAFLLLICHEIGHHLGGAPKSFRGNSGLRGWSSAEGQADYFATSKCLPLFFKSGIDIKSFDINQDSNDYKVALSKCRDNACARVTLAGLAVSRVFASMVNGTPQPQLTSRDATKVLKTIYNHPNPQCRLDTFLSGIYCELGPEVPFDSVDPKIGACLKDSGARPSCWFQEKVY